MFHNFVIFVISYAALESESYLKLKQKCVKNSSFSCNNMNNNNTNCIIIIIADKVNIVLVLPVTPLLYEKQT